MSYSKLLKKLRCIKISLILEIKFYLIKNKTQVQKIFIF